jgi:hypothetical protein
VGELTFRSIGASASATSRCCIFISLKRLALGGVDSPEGRNLIPERSNGHDDVRAPAGRPLGSTDAAPQERPRKDLVIGFTWQRIEKRQVEARPYPFRRGVLPKLPVGLSA